MLIPSNGSLEAGPGPAVQIKKEKLQRLVASPYD